MKSTRIAVLACMTIGIPLIAQTSPMRAGLWEITAQMDMPGMKMPEMKLNQCVTPEQLKDLASTLPNSTKDQTCKASDYKVDGNKVTWRMACPAQGLSGQGEMVFSGDTYTGTMNMSTAQGSMMMKYSGKRVGDCTK
jgi:uncharacterized protein DUF3617